MEAALQEEKRSGLASGAGWLVIVAAYFDLTGWWFHLPFMTSVLPNYATMKPNTALCLGLLAAAILAVRSNGRQVSYRSPVVLTCAGAALLICGATLCEYLTGHSLGIDQILATVPMERFGDPPGRMSFGTDICLLLTATSVLVLDLLPGLSTALVLTSVIAAASGLVGFVLQAGPLTDVIWFRSLAVHTATAILLLQVALMAVRPERQPFGALMQLRRTEGKRRYLLFTVLAAPLLLALPVVAGLQARFYDPRFALAFLVVLLMAVQTSVLWADNRALERAELRLRESKEALIQSEKLAAVGRLASSIAHEINNPLEAVTNLLYLVRTSSESPEIREYISIAERELQRASAITSQTLRFHKQETRPQAITGEELVDEVLSIYQGKIVNSKVLVEKQRFTGKPVLCFDGEIRQVLNNLVGNAIDAMSQQAGRLLLRSREGTDWRTGKQGLVITVADTGGGMSNVTVQRLFDPFYTTKGLHGTGLGLWVSQEIVARHRGRLRVRSSQHVGRTGSVFTLFLPFEAATR